jgi:hypothetical protein
MCQQLLSLSNPYQILTLSKYLDEKNPKLKEIYHRKAEEYLERA